MTFSPSSFDDMLGKVERLPMGSREDNSTGYRVWFGDVKGVAAHGPQNAVAYCVHYTHTGQPYRIQLLGTGWVWDDRQVQDALR